MLRLALPVLLLTAATPLKGTHYASLPDGADWVPDKELSAAASSSLCEGKGSKKSCHSPELVLNESNANAWCEGQKGAGEGAWLELTLPADREIAALQIVPYYAKGLKQAQSNGRPEKVTVEVGDQKFEAQLEDHVMRVLRENKEKLTEDDGPCGDETCVTQDERIQSAEGQFLIFPKPVKAKKVRLTIKSVFAGDSYEDTCITRVRVGAMKAAK